MSLFFNTNKLWNEFIIMSRRTQRLSMVTMTEMTGVALYQILLKHLEIYLFSKIHRQALSVILLEINDLFGEREKSSTPSTTYRPPQD